MFEIIGIAVVLWVVWKIIKAVGRTATTQAYHQGAAESMSLADARLALEEAEERFMGSQFSTGGNSASEQQSLLDKAAFLNDRVNQLTNRETGSVSRARYRAELIARASKTKTFLDKIHDSKPTGKMASADSFDDWLNEFKEGAGEANELLVTTDKGCLIDFMDISPLRRAHAEGIEPYQLGIEFGEQFDYDKFMGATGGSRIKNDNSTYDDDYRHTDYDELVSKYREFAEASGCAPTDKTSDLEIKEIYELITDEFFQIANERNENLSDETINSIVIKFIQVHESFGSELFNQHLHYELQKYRQEGLRPDYKKGLRIP